MYTTLMVFHGVVSILLILSVLLQFGKGAEAGLISGGASDAVFSGGQKGNILSKITIGLTVVFLANCIYLAHYQSSVGSRSLLDSEAPVAVPLGDFEDFGAQQPTEEAPATEESAPVSQ